MMRATVGIETVWLRSWMMGYMPSKLKQVLQIPEPAPDGSGAPAAPASGGPPKGGGPG